MNLCTRGGSGFDADVGPNRRRFPSYLTYCNLVIAALLPLIYASPSYLNIKMEIFNTKEISDNQIDNQQPSATTASLTPKDFEDISDLIYDTLTSLYQSTSYPPGSGAVFNFLASEEYRNYLRLQHITFKNGFAYVGQLQLESETGQITGHNIMGDLYLEFSGNIVYKDKIRNIKLYPLRGTRPYRKLRE